MSDINAAIAVWRRELETAGSLSMDDIRELESHLQQEMDALQQSGLLPDEAFVIASRRLGRPHDLAVEYSKNHRWMSWRHPARLMLWGVLLLDLVSLLWCVIQLGAEVTGVVESVGFSYWAYNLGNWIVLAVFWMLVNAPQGRVARLLAWMEDRVQTAVGAAALILAPLLVVFGVIIVRLMVWLYRTRVWVGAGQGVQNDNLGVGMILQLILSQLIWTVPITLLLILLIRAERSGERASPVTQ